MNEELPGMMAVAKGISEQRWPHTMDAQVWAKEFCQRFHPIDRDLHRVPMNTAEAEGLMIAWFANAIMAGYDTASALAQKDGLAWASRMGRTLGAVLSNTFGLAKR